MSAVLFIFSGFLGFAVALVQLAFFNATLWQGSVTYLNVTLAALLAFGILTLMRQRFPASFAA
ncbi:hypothetical protein PEL8287_01953 [Roseovarius litorisediminis]|uniref:Uncharacterized protein n=1 Tax=Roseovarius litorisediminis TaxID=1312363 RepID=A0A1Y5SI67_9RHOB|nr:hypothetical protein [Roseovarius litorisediminis]SLN39703.1 hypothetical protein PEL8287_01953 [Roseovarius litorisediminis]